MLQPRPICGNEPTKPASSGAWTEFTHHPPEKGNSLPERLTDLVSWF
jgi:hypothetical protein